MQQFYYQVLLKGKTSLKQIITSLCSHQLNLCKSNFLFLCCFLFIGIGKSMGQSSFAWQSISANSPSSGRSTYPSVAIHPNGVPYVAFMDDMNDGKATVKRFNGLDWLPVGAGVISDYMAYEVSMLIDREGTPFVAFVDVANGARATVKKFDGKNWVTVGAAGFSAGRVTYLSLALNGSQPYVAYQDGANGNKATVMEFDGTNWVTLGPAGFSAGVVRDVSLATSTYTGAPHVVYADESNGLKATVLYYGGNSFGWLRAGAETASAGGAAFTRLAFGPDDQPYVAFQDYSNGYKVTVTKRSGSKWVTVGAAGFSEGGADDIMLKMDAAKTPYVAFRDRGNGRKATVMKFEGANWGPVGAAGFSAGEAYSISMDFDRQNTPFVAYEDKSVGYRTAVMGFTRKYDVAPPVITTQPLEASIQAGGNTSLSVAASGDGNLTYQWQVSKDGGAFFSDVHDGGAYSGATTAKLNLTKVPISVNGDLYRAKVSNGPGTYSAFAKLNVTKGTFDNTRVWQALGKLDFSEGVVWNTTIALDSKGMPYVAFKDEENGKKATVMKYNGNSWETVGKVGFTGIEVFSPILALDPNDKPYIVYSHHPLGEKSTMMTFNGSDWETVGPEGFVNQGVQALDFDPTGIPHVVCEVSGTRNVLVLRYHNSVWEEVGNWGANYDRMGDRPVIAIDKSGTMYVAYIDVLSDSKLTVKKLVNNNWVAVGAIGFSPEKSTAIAFKLDRAGNPYIAYKTDHTTGFKPSAMRYNGTSWESLGKVGFAEGEVLHITLDFDATGMPLMAYQDANRNVTVMRFDGEGWSPVGKAGFSDGRVQFPNLATDENGIPYVVYQGPNGKAVVKRFVPFVNYAPNDLTLSSTSVNENVYANSAVGSFSSEDANAEDTHTYTLISGEGDTDNSVFSISGSDLKMKISPNYEVKKSYTIRVRTEDTNGGKLDKAFVITINDVNEAPKGLALSATFINENNVIGHVIATLSTQDEDEDENHIYELVDGAGSTGNAFFTIEANKLRTAIVFDREQKSAYNIRIQVKDKSGLTYSTSRIIDIRDVNEAPTAIVLSKEDINESNKVGAVIGTLSASDQDVNDFHSFAFVEGEGSSDNGAFVIEGNTLKAAQIFYFQLKDKYSIRIQAEDSKGLTYEEVKIITINYVEGTVTGIVDEKNQMLKVYPNPASQQLSISFDRTIESVSLVNSQGATVLTRQGSSDQIRLSLDPLSSGVYTVLISANGKLYSRRLVVAK
ncbi:cadherin domain-containing protein [Pontibacter anaerobius]|uniref:T9SS type A sorting domain-containing protein n=1 Tax=Pontibacter anaerobius TaxID=2993940 RepID=A0ABT3RC11_9BACT|nr:cadherin domain-containing protein [Pontibacter anaerobius]MCX2739066.1 T9SS type A sorting domain-containing protein [Pontibacter anaerobius]